MNNKELLDIQSNKKSTALTRSLIKVFASDNTIGRHIKKKLKFLPETNREYDFS
jgi:hypothetical protein